MKGDNMANCVKCGKTISEGVKFCPFCGTKSSGGSSVTTNDAESNKVMAILAYIIFFIPLITGDHKTSPFVKFHTNQGTILAILGIGYLIINLILRAIFSVRILYYSYTPAWLTVILLLLGLPLLAGCLYGIYNAATGRTVELPYIGKYRIIN